MTSIVVEDGVTNGGTTGANSYCTTAELTTYATNHDYTVVGDLSHLLLQAMDYLENQNFKGWKVTYTQPLVWPRTGVYIDGWFQQVFSIPAQLKTAQMAIALAIDAGNGPLADIQPNLKSETVGEISVTYQNSAAPFVINRTIANALHKLVVGGGSYGNMNSVSKA